MDIATLLAQYTDLVNQHGQDSDEARTFRAQHAANGELIGLMQTEDRVRAWLNQAPVTIVGLFHTDGKAQRFIATIRLDVSAKGTAWRGTMDQWPIDDGRTRPIALMTVVYDPDDSSVDLMFLLPGTQGQKDHLFTFKRADGSDWLGTCVIVGDEANAVSAACTLVTHKPDWLDRTKLDVLVRAHNRR